ncbi:hypothetical protein D3C86_1835350 [compost metagenome]
MVLGGGEPGFQLFQVDADLFDLRFQFCGELFLGSQLIGQILDVFGDGFDRIADMRELGVVLGLLALEQGLHLAEQLGAEAWLVFDFFER